MGNESVDIAEKENSDEDKPSQREGEEEKAGNCFQDPTDIYNSVFESACCNPLSFNFHFPSASH